MKYSVFLVSKNVTHSFQLDMKKWMKIAKTIFICSFLIAITAFTGPYVSKQVGLEIRRIELNRREGEIRKIYNNSHEKAQILSELEGVSVPNKHDIKLWGDTNTAKDVAYSEVESLVVKKGYQEQYIVTMYRNGIPSIKPTFGEVTSPMGGRTSPVNGKYENHRGVDIINRECPDFYLFATADGMVVRAENWGRYGNCIVINHYPTMYQTRYAHCSAIYVRPGERVKRGDIIGRMGATGEATGIHVHYEVLYRKCLKNPVKYFD